MKILYKLVIISLMFVVVQANDNFYKQYVKELLEFKIKLPQNIYNPFIQKYKTVSKVTKTKKTKKSRIRKTKKVKRFVFKQKKLTLLAILNNQALVKIPEINLKKWIKVGDKIDNYTLKKIINDNSILVSIKNKIKIIKMKENNVRIKVRK